MRTLWNVALLLCQNIGFRWVERRQRVVYVFMERF